MEDDVYDRPPPDPSAFRFDFDDVVRVVSDNPELAGINGELGAICGRGDDTENPGYGVFIYRDARVWCVDEPDLQPTGRRDEQGRGEIVGTRHL